MYDPAADETPPDFVRAMCDRNLSCRLARLERPNVQRHNQRSFKNALDWLKLLGDRNPPYLTDKVVGLISTAGGEQGLQAVNTMEFVVRASSRLGRSSGDLDCTSLEGL
jgi:FMN reductase